MAPLVGSPPAAPYRPPREAPAAVRGAWRWGDAALLAQELGQVGRLLCGLLCLVWFLLFKLQLYLVI